MTSMKLKLVAMMSTAALLTIGSGLASADGPDGMPGIPAGATFGSAPLPSSGATGSTASGTSGTSGTNTQAAPPAIPQASQPTPAAAAIPPKSTVVPKTELTKRCTWSTSHHRGIRTCSYLQHKKLVKTCVKTPSQKERCKTVHISSAGKTKALDFARTAGTRVNSGYVEPPSGTVVRIEWKFVNPTTHASWTSQCSGSMIARGLVLTAGHCVYSNQPDGSKESGFIGYYDVGSYTITPGADGPNSAPYGTWSVKNMWTTGDYASSGGVGGDWGIIETNPNSQGQYPGDIVGSLNATWNQPTIDQIYSTGYPAAFGFASAQNGGGTRQYFCDDDWSDGDHMTDSTFGSYYAMAVNPCEETGGASGGPVLTDTSSGWTIIGVNNRSPEPTSQNGFGSYMLSFYFEDRFGEFWNAVVAQVNAGQ